VENEGAERQGEAVTGRRLRRILLEWWIVLRGVWWNLAGFAGLLVVAALVMELSGCYPEARFHERLVQALYMSRVESVSGYEHRCLPSVMVFLMPLLALLILGEGALRVAAIYLARKQHRTEWEKLLVETLTGHLVLCGAGELGRALLAELLRRNPELELVIVDTHAEILEELGLQNRDLHHIHGDMTSIETLTAANVAKAATVLLLAGEDARNVEAAFKAQKLNPRAQIWVRLSRVGVADFMGAAAPANVRFFTPYQWAAGALADELGKKA